MSEFCKVLGHCLAQIKGDIDYIGPTYRHQRLSVNPHEFNVVVNQFEENEIYL